MQVRYGKSAEMEFTFSRTERGRMFWAANHMQIRNALMATMMFAIIVAIMNSKMALNNNVDNAGRGPYFRGAEPPNGGAGVTRAMYEMALKADMMAFDRINKINNPLDRIVEDGLKHINSGSGGDTFSGGQNVNITADEVTVAFPRGAGFAVRHSNLHNDPRTTGRPRDDKFEEEKIDGVRRAPGGYNQVQSRIFNGNDGEPIDPQFSTQNIGYFSVMFGGADWVSDADYTAGAASLANNSATALSVGSAAAGLPQQQQAVRDMVVPTLLQLLGSVPYRTESCQMDIWKADDDNWWTCGYGATVRASQMYQSPDAASGSGKRQITAVGAAMLLNGASVRQRGGALAGASAVAAGGFGAKPDADFSWYAKRNEQTETDEQRLSFAAAAQARIAAASYYIHHGIDVANVISAHDYWGHELSSKMAHHIVQAYNGSNRMAFLKAAAAMTPVNGGGPRVAADPNDPTLSQINMAREWMKNVSMIDSGFMDLCLDFNIPIFAQHIVVIPWSQWEVGATIVFRSSNATLNGIAGTGGGVGELVYGNPSYRIAYNANPGHYVAQFNIWFKPFVRNAQYIYIDVTSFVSRHLRGDNGEFFNTNDHNQLNRDTSYNYARNAWETNPEAMRTTFSIALPPQAKLFKSDHFDISGAYATSACSEKRGTAHYCTAPFYANYWNWRAVDSVGKQDATRSVRVGNTIVSRNVSQRRDAKTGKVQRWLAKNHFGKKLEPGHVTSRMETSLRQQDVPDNSYEAIY